MVMLWMVLIASPVMAASEWLRVLEKAEAAREFEDRLHTHREALDAILKADAATLAHELEVWGGSHEWPRRNPFIRLAWTHLAKLDQMAALAALAEVYHQDAFEEAAQEVWAAIAETNPAMAYEAAQKLAPRDKNQHSARWLVQHIMRAVGASWFRETGPEALNRLPTLSHPELMATAVFHGGMREARKTEDWLALLDRYTRGEEPVIEESHPKARHLCEELVEPVARLDLAKTKAWIEQRFPLGSEHEQSEHARRALFFVWLPKEPLAAAEWFAAQSPSNAWDLYQCLHAVAGEDWQNLPAALDWLVARKGQNDRVKAIQQFHEFHAEDPAFREPMQTLVRWFAGRPVEEREKMPAVPPEGIEPTPWLLRTFHLPVSTEKTAVNAEDERRCHELARQHELSRTAVDPTIRREGMRALEWMQQAATKDLRAILLARLRDHRMDWFTEDLLSAWVLKDWHEAEAFALHAPLSTQKRNDMLIHLFSEAALKQPDAVLQRLNELQAAKTLNPAALGGQKSAAQVLWKTYYYGEMITRALAIGWCRQDGRQALAKVQALPPSWQESALETLAEESADRR
jgi:hypothetical protein